jgi:hypothetical protein
VLKMFEQSYMQASSHHQQQQHHHPMQAQMNYVNSQQKMHRSISNSNVNNAQRASDCHVEYEVSMPVPIITRHTPYHSLWNLHQW